ncbi:unnamed protein product [Lepeophtheirus salmonis]|uniref:(salmon louse) hypothetical protein n=1 Tax=Lepeophtheirus salmonis TaxID=72036 RepID=A0A7R8D0M9_LEPSM|nr:unnamed protein product [Lepeophtheirus salmonis]CAF2986046.1 unnamed protein product [Lepeophtheirus salmonis]
MSQNVENNHMVSDKDSPWTKRISMLLRKYLWEGQSLHKSVKVSVEENDSWRKKMMILHRRVIGIAIPFFICQITWWCLAIKHDYFSLFPDRYIMTLTMILGATVAGMTSEGGGAVAFPVMTLALKIDPKVARDFSLMIQSVGMTCLEVFDSMLSPPVKKLGFVCIWFSFAFALFLLNINHKRKTYNAIPNFGIWQACVLTVVGFFGGIFSAIAGSGVDICSFSILSLLFRVSEKISTPTSVVLMAANSIVGTFWRNFMMDGGAEIEAKNYMAVCVVVVTFFAPLGSILSSHFHRHILASLIYILDTIALVSALVIIPMTQTHIILCVSILLLGFIFFYVLSFLGSKLLERQIQRENEEAAILPIASSIENNDPSIHYSNATLSSIL